MINWEGCGRKGIWRKKWGMMEVGDTNRPDGVATRRIVGASASVIFPCAIKSTKFASNNYIGTVTVVL